MKKVTLLAAAAAVTALATSPVLAQDSMQPRAATHAKSYKANKHAMMHSSRAMHRHHARAAYRADKMASRDNWNNRDTWHERDTGFWPADVVGGAVGAAGAIATTAVGTAGAIATAPFGGPDYAYNNGYRGGYYASGPNYNPNGPAGYPYGNRHRYGASYASADYGPDYGYPGGYQYNGVAIPMSGNFDARNGFTCRPGSITRIGNEQVICQ